MIWRSCRSERIDRGCARIVRLSRRCGWQMMPGRITSCRSIIRPLASAAVCFWAAFPLLFSATRSRAESAPAPAVQYLDSEYLVQTWQTEQGLPDNYVNAIAQTPDGYLWIATFNGLARFNGVAFVVF